MYEKYLRETKIRIIDYRCECCGGLPPNLYVDREMSIEYALFLNAYKLICDEYGKEIPITRGYSCSKHNTFIFLKKVKDKYGPLNDEKIIQIINNSSMTPFSVHPFGLALDIQPDNKEEIEKVVKIAKKIKPKLRIGWRGYLSNVRPHIHIDMGFLITPRWSNALIEGMEW